ncbi:MAG: zinc-dependent metalloprotease [Saprospiraceae bacterium]
MNFIKISFTKLLLLISITLLSINEITAQQHQCGFDNIREKARAENPNYEAHRRTIEAFTKSYTASSRSGITKIPTVIHVIHNGEAVGTYPNISDAQIQSAIDNLNDAFQNIGPYSGSTYYNNPMDVEFALAKVAPDGSATTGIERHDISGKAYATTYFNNGLRADVSGVHASTLMPDYIWNPQDYMNIWIVKEIDGVDIGTGAGGILGYATLPNSFAGSEDGLVCQARCFGYDPTLSQGFDFGTAGISGNGTADHEVGHYLNLLHTFEGDPNGNTCPPLNGTIGVDDDGCADIPPHKTTESICPAFSATANTCVSPNGSNEYIHNFMNYSSDDCFTGFSNDQRTRCHAAIDGPRVAFKTSIGDENPVGTYPTAVTASVTNSGTDNMGIYDITLNGTTFKSQGSYYDGGYLNRIASQPTVDLDYNTAYTLTVQVGVGNNNWNEHVAVYIDYNNNGDFSDAGEEIFKSPTAGGLKNGAIFSIPFTTPASGGSVPAATRLRMRIMSDFDNNGASSVFTGPTDYPNDGGQIEDYSISFGAVVPVELIDFRAEKAENTSALQWATATEINNKGFQVERSQDGRNFETIGFVEGHGTTVQMHYYDFVDNTPFDGTNYYRLKQIDTDGRFEYSKVKIVVFENSLEKTVALYPNPTQGILNLQTLQTGKVFVYNTLGQMVQSINVNNEITTIDLTNLPNGQYFVSFISNSGERMTKKIIKD